MTSTICLFFSYFIEAVILQQYTNTLFIPRRGTKTADSASRTQPLHSTEAVVLYALYLILFLAALFHVKWLNAFLYFLAGFIFLITQYRLKWQSAFFHSAILTAVMSLCELTVYSIVEYFASHFPINASDFYNEIIFTVLSKMIFFTIIHILLHFLKGQREYSRQRDNFALFLFCVPFTSVFIMLTFVAVSDTCALSPVLNSMVAFGAVFLLTTNLLVFGIYQYSRKKNAEFTEMQLLLQKEANSAEYYKMLLAQNENQNILIHDMKKHLQSIDILNSKGEASKIGAYIRQLMLSSDLKETSRICDHELLNAILCRYQKQCGSMKISFHADIRSGTVDFVADNDLTSLFCNLLDNAMEAAAGIPESFVEVSAHQKNNTRFVIISVINSCRKNPFSHSSDSLISSKEDNRRHGFGIKSIQKAARKYQGDMQMYYNADTLTFHSIITMKQ